MCLRTLFCLFSLSGVLGGPVTFAAQAAGIGDHCGSGQDPLPAPILDVRTFGARGNGVDDDTAAINAAIEAVPPGGTIYFPPGTYVHANYLRIATDGVTLAGKDATLHASQPDRGAVFLDGSGNTLQDLTITSAEPPSRGDKLATSGIVLRGKGGRVLRNSISRSMSTGIRVSGAENYEITCNTVVDTLADGIHSTDGARGGLVRFNHVRNSGDDGISVVSYNDKQRASSIRIEDNTVEQLRWGRGISVIGSTDIQIRRNRIAKIAMAAGVIVAREQAWGTPGASGVVIAENTISDIQQNIAPKPFAMRTGHGAIEINSDASTPDLSVTGVQISDNGIDGSAFDGIRLLGNVCDVTIERNQLRDITGDPIMIRSDCASPVRQCSANTSADQPVSCP
jgi:hypothetical protein